MEVKYSGLTALILSATIIPAWFLAGLGFSFINLGRSANFSWSYYPYWIFASLWIFTPGILGTSKLIYIWLDDSRNSPLWDICLGILSIFIFISALIWVYKFHTMRIGPSLL